MIQSQALVFSAKFSALLQLILALVSVTVGYMILIKTKDLLRNTLRFFFWVLVIVLLLKVVRMLNAFGMLPLPLQSILLDVLNLLFFVFLIWGMYKLYQLFDGVAGEGKTSKKKVKRSGKP